MVMTVKAVLIRLLSVVCTTTIKLNCQFLKKPGMFKKRNSLELIIRSLENTLALPLNIIYENNLCLQRDRREFSRFSKYKHFKS